MKGLNNLISVLLLSLIFISCQSEITGRFPSKGTNTPGGGGTPVTPADDPNFISVWRTTAPNETITLPLVSGFNYNFEVSWGDGTTSTITAFDDADITHTYVAAGDYTVTISGSAEAWSFQGSADGDKIIEVQNFGDLGWKNLSGAFANCRQLLSFAGGKTEDVTDMSNMFNTANKMTSLDLSSFNTSNVTDMTAMFQLTSVLSTLNLSNFNTANVTNMTRLFSGAGALSIDVSSFNTTNVISMQQMFGYSKATQILGFNSPSFDTSNVTNMSSMFLAAGALISLDLSSFNTSNVTNMDMMFAWPGTAYDLTLNNWDIDPLPSATNIFNGYAGTLYCNQGTMFGRACNQKSPDLRGEGQIHYSIIHTPDLIQNWISAFHAHWNANLVYQASLFKISLICTEKIFR